MYMYIYTMDKRKTEDSLDSIEPWHSGHSEHAEGSRMGVWLVALGTNQISYILKVSDAQRGTNFNGEIQTTQFLSSPFLSLTYDVFWEWDARLHPLT